MKAIMFAAKIIRYLTLLSVTFSIFFSAQLLAQSRHCTEYCNWYNTNFPLCKNQDDGWSWENSTNCIGRTTCMDQWGDFGVETQCANENSDTELCAAIQGRTYYTNSVFASVYVDNEPVFERKSLRFLDGEYEFKYGVSSRPQTGAYRCENGEVLASIYHNDSYTIHFSEDKSTLDFNNYNSLPRDTYRLESSANADCSLVENTLYESSDSDPETQASWITFGMQPEIQMGMPGGAYPEIHFDCVTGSLLINRSHNDGNPTEVNIEDEGASIVAEINPGSLWRYYRKDSSVCGRLFKQVCSVIATDNECDTQPCGLHKTFDNRCQSNLVDALYLHKGSCGEIEGQPYYEATNSSCSGEYTPVCAAATQLEPCFQTPCPVQSYKTYSDICQMRKASLGANFIHEGECDAQEEGKRVLDNSDKGLICAAVYQPVCAKDEGAAACVTTPCDTHLYKTFGNTCEAKVAVTDTVWSNRDCGELENTLANPYPPVQLVNRLTEVDVPPKINSATIDDDQLTVELEFTGCGGQNFEFEVSESFSESYPLQASWAFVPQNYQQCQAQIEIVFVFDLLPLKIHYEQLYGKKSATILLQGLVEYKINQE